MIYRGFAHEPREDKLPGWVQEKLSSLRLRVVTLETRINEISTGKEPSNFWFEDLDGNRYYIPVLCYLKFSDGSPHGGISIDYRPRGGRDYGLYLNGEGALFIKPSASNACYVKSER